MREAASGGPGEIGHHQAACVLEAVEAFTRLDCPSPKPPHPSRSSYSNKEHFMNHVCRIALAVVCSAMLGATGFAADAKLDAAQIERLTAAKGKLDEKEGVFKVSLPRSDLHVTAGGVKM